MALLVEILIPLYLFVALTVTAVAVHVKRRRLYVFSVMLISLGVLGFYKNGCICSVGSFQNIILAFIDSSYILPVSGAIAFFIPLVAAFLWGRVFCGGVCPLGGMQDIVNVVRIRFPRPVLAVFAMGPYAVLAFSVISLLNGFGFIVCKYDPFIIFFRMNGVVISFILGCSFLVASLFIARPFCRFFCPYSVLLSWFSRFSIRKITITPNDCIQCSLCKKVCPVEAIHPPKKDPIAKMSIGKVSISLWPVAVVVSLIVALFFVYGSVRVSISTEITDRLKAIESELAVLHSGGVEQNQDAKVNDKSTEENNGEEINEEEDVSESSEDIAGAIDELEGESVILRENLAKQKAIGLLTGLIIGLFAGLHLLYIIVLRKRKPEYHIDSADCIACGRCFSHCVVRPLPPFTGIKKFIIFEQLLSHMAHRWALSKSFRIIMWGLAFLMIFGIADGSKGYYNGVMVADEINLVKNKDLIKMRLQLKKDPTLVQQYYQQEENLRGEYLGAVDKQKMNLVLMFASFIIMAAALKTIRNGSRPKCFVVKKQLKKEIPVPEKKKHIIYSVNDNCIGCTKCAQKCPVNAITSIPYVKHAIDINKCIRCDACKKACPSNAIDVSAQ